MNEHITNKMPSGLITVNREGRILSHNPASDRIFDGKLSKNAMLRSMVRESDALQALLVGSSRVDLQACKLEYSIVSPK